MKLAKSATSAILRVKLITPWTLARLAHIAALSSLPTSFACAMSIPAARSAPSLPTEIVADIIKLALPPLKFVTFATRSAMLLRFALSSTWRVLVQQEFFACPLINSGKSAAGFLDALMRRDREALNGWTRGSETRVAVQCTK
jgi:hypothetical protein